MKNKYYVIGRTDIENPPLPHSNSWPKLIAFSFENMNILIIVGRGHGLAGGCIELCKFNVHDWLDVFHDTNSDWFKDWIVSGEAIKNNGEENLKKLLMLHHGIELIDY